MKKTLLVLFAAICCAGLLPPARAEGFPFSDVTSEDRFYDGIRYVYEKGLMVGDGSGLFYPNRTLSRAELVEILYKLEGKPRTEASVSFPDVPADSWFSDAVVWAKANGIIYGTPEGLFAPLDDVDMEQFTVSLMRYAKVNRMTASATSREGASDWAVAALDWAAEIGIEPEEDVKETVTRERASQLLKQFCERTGEITAVNCTVWPMTDLAVYSAPDGEEEVGVALSSDFFTVLAEENGRFRIESGSVSGYIDSADCLIDLSEYLGEVCAYDIKNSYDAIYNVNGYGIPNVTGTVIPGYEQTVRERGTNGPTQTAVPLLYPTAQKVAKAAVKAQKMGYRLKIYDAFRPYAASQYLYKTTELILQKKLPELPYSQMTEEQWREYVENMPDSTGRRGSFYFEMTRGDYMLSVFLAQNTSAHNYGIALDLTLERLNDGKELQMQTGMHELSWRSFRNENNRNADLLSNIMISSGLAPLFSEWWHFQDDELRQRRPDLPARMEGVTVDILSEEVRNT